MRKGSKEICGNEDIGVPFCQKDKGHEGSHESWSSTHHFVWGKSKPFEEIWVSEETTENFTKNRCQNWIRRFQCAKFYGHEGKCSTPLNPKIEECWCDDMNPLHVCNFHHR